MQANDFVIASDFDGTLKPKGKSVSLNVLKELAILRKKRVGLILATGRCLNELSSLIDLELFDAVILENGALILHGNKLTNLAPPGWEKIREDLIRRFGEGCEKVIISLLRNAKLDLKGIPDDKLVLEYNKDRIMILPRGISKGKGLTFALKNLGWEKKKLICVGDGENDETMLLLADFKIALKNSVERLKQIADYVAGEEDGKGFVVAIRKILSDQQNE